MTQNLIRLIYPRHKEVGIPNNGVKMRRVIFTLIFFALPIMVMADESRYFEFAPDISKALKIVNVDTPYQPFIPYNDFVSGFDIWIDNSGSPGEASFGLRTENDELIAAKTVSIPTSPFKWGGTRFRVDFENSVHVSSGQTYKIKIVSSMPALHLYYSNRIQLLEHNENYTLWSAVLPARLGSVDQNFAFKYALYEKEDNLPPIISNVTTTVLNNEIVRLDFNANEPVDWSIDYFDPEKNDNRTIDFNGSYGFCNEGLNVCSIEMSTLAEATYNYILTVKDEWGNLKFANGIFIGHPKSIFETQPSITSITSPIAAPSDISAPIISNARIVSLNEDSVKLVWTTDEAADSRLLISLDSLGTKIVGIMNDAAYELEHLLWSGNVLNPETQYYGTIVSADITGNVAGQTFGFATLKATSTPPQAPDQPSQSAPTSTPSQNQNQTQPPPVPKLGGEGGSSKPPVEAKVSISDNGEVNLDLKWSEPAAGEQIESYRIDIFDENRKIVKQITVEAGNYETTIKNLAPGRYYLVFYARKNGIFEKISEAIDVTIPNPPRSIKFLRYGIYSGLAIFITILAIYMSRHRRVLSKKIISKANKIQEDEISTYQK